MSPNQAGVNGPVLYAWDTPPNTMAAAYTSVWYHREGDCIYVESNESAQGVAVAMFAPGSKLDETGTRVDQPGQESIELDLVYESGGGGGVSSESGNWSVEARSYIEGCKNADTADRVMYLNNWIAG